MEHSGQEKPLLWLTRLRLSPDLTFPHSLACYALATLARFLYLAFICQASSCFRAFALGVASTWNVVLPAPYMAAPFLSLGFRTKDLRDGFFNYL